ncbi:tetratricopeptide repeat protein [Nocardia sp. CDC160]|uniref:tetratricopeptide repeat protein n=1 Tax=Nocardia sp. CDC160 TaxID=3112166 RepID=UPI002DBCD6FC|nr:tetratricopeptide repeat protein [Nocardia sp. CDC160]MEC3919416.1 tetratricopeptide repeat protein [Nocardia sp. CDC160]
MGVVDQYRRDAEAGSVAAMYLLGLTLHDQGETTEGLIWLRRAATRGQRDAMVALGEILRRQGQTEAAEKWFQRAAHTVNAGPPLWIPTQPGQGLPYAPPPPRLTSMPRPVRVAQILTLVLAGFGVCFFLYFLASGDSYIAGAYLFMLIPVLCAAVAVLFFGQARNGARITTMVFAGLTIFMNVLGALGGGQGGIFAILWGITVIVLLSLDVSGRWFRG